MFITKNGMVKSVTKGVYKELYEHNGWEPSGEVEFIDNKGKTFMHPQPIEDSSYSFSQTDYTYDDYSKVTDFEDMSYQELLSYAKDHGIQLGRVRKQEDIIALLRGELE